MQTPITPQEARAALDTIDRGRRWVVDEIDLPRWYRWGLALGWIALGRSGGPQLLAWVRRRAAQASAA